MNVIDKKVFNWKDFRPFEKEKDLFSIRNKRGLFIWDIIRYDVYMSLLRGNAGNDEIYPKKSAVRYAEFLNDLLSLCWFILFKKCKYFFLSLARNKDLNGKFYDQNIEDVLKLFYKDSLILETFGRDKIKFRYQHFIYNRIAIIKKICTPFLKNDDYSQIISLITERYGYCVLTNTDINRLIKDFRIEYVYYKFLLKIKKIKLAFITQNGIQKALFAATRDLNIPIVEFQHGLIEPEHIAYSYNPDIKYDNRQIYLPDYFFSFSEYWTKAVFLPVKHIVPIGNTAFFNGGSTGKTQNPSLVQEGFVVVSANVYGEELKKLVLEFEETDSQTPVYFKLHPNQFNEYDYYCSVFANHKNVQVIKGERTMQELIAITKAVLIIKSTAIYEALHAERMGIVFQQQKDLSADPILSFPNVHVVSNAAELAAALNNRFEANASSAGIFFKAFDKGLFSEFMKSINN